MTIIPALIDRLAADSTVSGYVGSRIYGDEMPQADSFPALVLTLISRPRQYELAGSTGFSHPRVQIEAWAATKATAVSILSAVAASLDGARFTYGSATVGPCRIVDERDVPSLLQIMPQSRGRFIDVQCWLEE